MISSWRLKRFRNVEVVLFRHCKLNVVMMPIDCRVGMLFYEYQKVITISFDFILDSCINYFYI